ncbi:MAG: slipin family protein [Planctomycetaceae bacterium]
MFLIKRYKIRSFEVGLCFHDGEFTGLLNAGIHWRWDPCNQLRIEIVSRRDPWLFHEKLDLIAKAGALDDQAEILDLKDHQRALVWIDGRFDRVLSAGLYAYWSGCRAVRVEIVDARDVRFEHAEFNTIVRSNRMGQMLDICVIQRNHLGVLFQDGTFVDILPPGQYAFWKDTVEARVVEVDTRETIVDINGQEIMTADKVSMRLNAQVTYRIVEARKAISTSDDARQSLYRETQLALRAVIGTRELEAFLAAKDAVAEEVEAMLRHRANVLGLEITSIGIRDVILPGDMQDLMNKVTEARKAAEANLIGRREETAAMRSQANTAKLLADNPTLMRLRELEILEQVAKSSQLNVVLGEKGLTERVVNLL